MLGVVDPRTLYDEVDTDLMALWLAYFALKNGHANGEEPPVIDENNVDQMVGAVERMLM